MAADSAPFVAPAPRGVLAWHICGAVLQSAGGAVLWILPLLVRKQFGADDWLTFLITVTPAVLFSVSIFWHELFDRWSIARALTVYWLIGVVPLGVCGWAREYWQLFIGYFIACTGAAAWSPIQGALMRRLYDSRTRGRAFGLINGAGLLGVMLSAWFIGAWLERSTESFRVFMPLIAVIQGVGIGILALIALRHAPFPPTAAREREPILRRITQPLLRMREVLKADPVFFRYERAFMTYGIGWMICNALLPILADRNLHFTYAQYAHATQVFTQIGNIAMAYPLGRLLDRIGAVRLSSLSFAALALYPLGLLFSRNSVDVAIVSLVYGACMAGVQHGWLLGPVALAGSAEKAPTYVAIHTTLVGIRGIVAQGLGMMIYRATGSITAPMVIAAAAFLHSAWQMRQLRAATADRLALVR
ncbi:MAG: MFS transporter [Phycisphaerales bacterium]|nr:MFS transporter [Phycisphaerales bacterium]